MPASLNWSDGRATDHAAELSKKAQSYASSLIKNREQS